MSLQKVAIRKCDRILEKPSTWQICVFKMLASEFISAFVWEIFKAEGWEILV